MRLSECYLLHLEDHVLMLDQCGSRNLPISFKCVENMTQVEGS